MFLLWPISSYQHKANEHSIKKKYIYQLHHHQQKTNGDPAPFSVLDTALWPVTWSQSGAFMTARGPRGENWIQYW